MLPYSLKKCPALCREEVAATPHLHGPVQLLDNSHFLSTNTRIGRVVEASMFVDLLLQAR